MAFVGDAIVGAVLGELLKAVMEVNKETERFKDVLQSMESTLRSITPEVEKIRELNKALDRGDEEIRKLWEIIKNGEKLVRDCLKTGCCKKGGKKKELIKLNDSLKTFCQIELPVTQTRIQKETLVEMMETREAMEDTHAEVKEMHKQVKDINEEVKEIHGTVKDEHKQVTDIQNRVKDTGIKVNEMHQQVKGIQEGLGEVKDMQGNVKDVNEQVEDTHDEVKDMHQEVKLVHAEVKEVKDILQRSVSNNASSRPCAPPDPPQFTVGLDWHLAELKKELFKDGESVVVLSAPGGCGKTTLAKKICRDEEVEGKFKENIFFVTVSKRPNLKIIIQQLFLHTGYQVPEIRSDENAVHCFERLLKQIGRKPILLVLDDVWHESNSLLDKFIFPIKDYKILVTSTSTFPRFGCTYKLEPLNSNDAMSLFRHSACLQDGSYDYNSFDEDVVNKIVKACKGFPLALTVVGRSLCKQPTEIWKARERELSKGGAIFKYDDLLNCLQSSLDVLENKDPIKECYMDLGSFPEGQLIPATVLIDLWVELYDLDEDGVSSVANLYELSSLNLVNLVVTRKDANEVDGYYNDHFVTQHDLLRELVIHLSSLNPIEQRERLMVDMSGNKFPVWWRKLKHQPVCARRLSISTDDTFTSNWRHMQAPEVEVLVLNFQTKNYMLPEFMRDLNNLKALVVTNYGFFTAEISNSPLLGDMSNLRRIRLEKILISSLTLNSAQLKNVQKISLFSCNFSPSFANNTIQISEALPNLSEINIDHCNYLEKLPVGLFDIICLRKLSITYCHELSTLPTEVGQLVNLEVMRLSSCIKLSEFPDTIGSLHKLSILDISNCQSIRKLPEQIGELGALRKLYMIGCLNCVLPKSVASLKGLKSVICDEETAKLWKPFIRSLRNLRIKV